MNQAEGTDASMTPGKALRRLLGPHLARRVGRRYRSIFVDLAKVAGVLSAAIPQGANVLDIGGGDGEPINHLLALRPDLTVTTIDPAPVVGQWIETRYHSRVIRLPRTTLAECLAENRYAPDVVLIADVLHHIPPAGRRDFLTSLQILLQRAPRLRMIVKDVEPGSWRALMGYWSDRYVTGDRHVSLISSTEMMSLFEEVLGPLHRETTALFEIDKPNYAIVFDR